MSSKHHHTRESSVARPDLTNEFSAITVLQEDIHLATTKVRLIAGIGAQGWVHHSDHLLLIGMELLAKCNHSFLRELDRIKGEILHSIHVINVNPGNFHCWCTQPFELILRVPFTITSCVVAKKLTGNVGFLVPVDSPLNVINVPVSVSAMVPTQHPLSWRKRKEKN